MKNTEVVTSRGEIAMSKKGFGVRLNYLDFGREAGEEQHLGLVLFYCLRGTCFPCGGVTNDVARIRFIEPLDVFFAFGARDRERAPEVCEGDPGVWWAWFVVFAGGWN